MTHSSLIDPHTEVCEHRLSHKALIHCLLAASLFLIGLGDAFAQSCPGATPPAGCTALPISNANADVSVSDCKTVSSGTYTYHYLHIVDGGTLFFIDDGKDINFNAKSILVEQGGRVQAGAWCKPYGSAGNKLTIGLWGTGPSDPASNSLPNYDAIQCVGHSGQCYNPSRVGKGCIHSGAGFNATDPCQATLAVDHSQDNAYFEGYANLDQDNTPFGYKVFAISYGGSVELFGAKGSSSDGNPATAQTSCPVPANKDQTDITQWANLSQTSWVRLNASNTIGSQALILDRKVDWDKGDQIVVTTTDWYTSHSELLTVGGFNSANNTLSLMSPLANIHNGEAYSVPSALSASTGNPNTQVDTRAAVGLLSRSIIIKSLGATANDAFPTAASCHGDASDPDCYFGGHVIVRQGFAKLQMQGVEFYQLGQGARMGHYPMHFHMVKDTAYAGSTFVKDSAIWDSNTRFAVIHASHGIILARNVGYLSMGHGFYIEDGSEINNQLCYNLGVSARPSLGEYFSAQPAGSPTQRYIPPILDTMRDGTLQGSDSLYPSMFWIMNAYNEFVGNHSAGVHGFGACYWPLSSSVSGPSVNLHWARSTFNGTPTYQTNSEKDYAFFNQAGARQAPFKRFRGNSCSTATYALMTERESLIPNAGTLTPAWLPNGQSSLIDVVKSPYTVSAAMKPNVTSNFYATPFAKSGNMNPTCTPGSAGALSSNPDSCIATVIDRFTTSYNWAQTNFGSVWLRPWHYLFVNSAITDQLFGGLGFVSGGSWNQVLPQQLAITKDSIYVGLTQSGVNDAGKTGPDITQGVCSTTGSQNEPEAMPFCYMEEDGSGIYIGGYNPKRLITIYDGPFFADGNIFTEIDTFKADVTVHSPTNPSYAAGIYDSTNQPWIDTGSGSGQFEVVDAAIGWKQPNGFYYPPAFAFRKSGFDSTSERHNVFDQYKEYVQGNVIGAPIHQPLFDFGDATPIDFTTILNDLDGSLNGMIPSGASIKSERTSGLSNNDFFDAPNGMAQCHSFGTQTLPFEFVTTVVTKLLAPITTSSGSSYTDPNWMGGKPAVPVYRQLKLSTSGDACSTTSSVCDGANLGCRRGTFFMGAQIGAAPGLTMQNGTFYVDTDAQAMSCVKATGYAPATFTAGDAYLVHHLYASDDSAVTYQIYVGTNYQDNGQWVRVNPHKHSVASANQMSVVAKSTPFGSASYDQTSGILTVTLDNSTIESDYAFPATAAAAANACQPRNLCQPDIAHQQCTLASSFSEPGLSNTVKDVCEYWVTRTNAVGADATYTDDRVFLNDCPEGGCIGYAFTLPSGFSGSSYASAGLGLASCYQQADWDIQLKQTDTQCPAPTNQGNFCAN